VVEVLGESRESHDVHRFIHHSSSIKLTRALPPIQHCASIGQSAANDLAADQANGENGPKWQVICSRVLRARIRWWSGGISKRPHGAGVYSVCRSWQLLITGTMRSVKHRWRLHVHTALWRVLLPMAEYSCGRKTRDWAG
jgi:hypothetical protein